MTTSNFVKFVVNGLEYKENNSITLLLDKDVTIEAVYQAIQPSDTLIETYKGYLIWQSATDGSLYVTDPSGKILNNQLKTLAEAEAWIDSYQPPTLPTLPALISIGTLIYFSTPI